MKLTRGCLCVELKIISTSFERLLAKNHCCEAPGLGHLLVLLGGMLSLIWLNTGPSAWSELILWMLSISGSVSMPLSQGG